ncbi:MAG: DUF6071 family protein [Neisseriaceae bacterium]|jgi:hypothetical protein
MSETIFLANGCSMCYGSELYDDLETRKCFDNVERFKNSWPGKLGSTLGFNQVVNLGYPGGSNDRILRTTITWILQNWSSNSKNNLFVIIGWSSPMRREFYLNEKWRQLIPHHDYSDPEASILNRVYREIAWSTYESAIRFAIQVITLQNFLKQHNIPYLFFDAISSFSKTNLDSESAIDLYIPFIDKKHYFKFGSENCSMADYLKTNENGNRHPNIEEHKKWANILIEFIKEENLLTDSLQLNENLPITFSGIDEVEIYDKKIGLSAQPSSVNNLFARLEALNNANFSTQTRKEGLLNKIRKAFKRDPFIYE